MASFLCVLCEKLSPLTGLALIVIAVFQRFTPLAIDFSPYRGTEKTPESSLEDMVAKLRLDCLGSYQIDAALEQPFEQFLEFHIAVEGFGLEVDKEVEIAAVGGSERGSAFVVASFQLVLIFPASWKLATTKRRYPGMTTIERCLILGFILTLKAGPCYSYRSYRLWRHESAQKR